MKLEPGQSTRDAAAEAAGKIHTDIQKGFIRAEVVSFDDMMAYSGRVGAREAGKVRAEGRDYIVKDGDVILLCIVNLEPVFQIRN